MGFLTKSSGHLLSGSSYIQAALTLGQVGSRGADNTGGIRASPQSQTCRTRRVFCLVPRPELRAPRPFTHLALGLISEMAAVPFCNRFHAGFQLRVATWEPSLQVHSCITWKTLTLPGCHTSSPFLSAHPDETPGAAVSRNRFSVAPTGGLCPKLSSVRSVCLPVCVCECVFHT